MGINLKRIKRLDRTKRNMFNAALRELKKEDKLSKEKAAFKKFQREVLGDNFEHINKVKAQELEEKLVGPAVETAILLDKILLADLNELIRNDDGSQACRRRIIREAVSYAEVICHGYQNLGAIPLAIYGLDQLARNGYKEPHFYEEDELKAIQGNLKGTKEKIKALTIVGHKVLFNREATYNFNRAAWSKAAELLAKRHDVTHPSKLDHIRITDNEWEDFKEGISGLNEVVYEPLQKLNEKFLEEES